MLLRWPSCGIYPDIPTFVQAFLFPTEKEKRPRQERYSFSLLPVSYHSGFQDTRYGQA